jgi:hypothetical protein
MPSLTSMLHVNGHPGLSVSTRQVLSLSRGPSNNGTKSGDKGLTQGMGGWLSP